MRSVHRTRPSLFVSTGKEVSMFAIRITAFTTMFAFTTHAAFAEGTEEVVVSASRVPIAADRAGSAVSVIDAETLEQRQASQVFDALRAVPGVEVSRTGTVGSLAQIRIRGAEAGHTLVLIDGVRVNDPAQSSEEFNFAHLMTGGIERVEVLRGPQSALWGADALAGVVNVITVRPAEGFDAHARAEYGSFDTKNIYARGSGGTADFGALAQAGWLDTSGVNIARTGHEDDGYRSVSFGAKAFANLTPNITVRASVNHIDARTDSEATDFFGTFSIPLDSGDFTDFTATYARASAEAAFGDVRLIAGASLVRTEAQNHTSAFGAPFDVAFNDRTEGGDTAFDLQLHVPWEGWGAEQRVSVLAETHRETFDMMRLDLPSANQSQYERRSAVAGEYWIGLTDVAISLGARHDWNDSFDDATTWRATVSWRAAKPWRVHASAGTGVKNPDFFELFGFFPAPAFVGNPNLTPEKSFGYDLGLEWRPRDDLLFDVTYFHADLEDEIFSDFSVFPNTARNATGESTRQGIEITAHAEIGHGVTLDAAYTWLDANEVNDATEIRRPNHIASASVNWRFADDRANVNLGVDYHGRQRDTAFLNGPPFSMPVTLDAYSLVRVAGSYDVTEQLTLFARVENAFDEKYEEVFGYRTRGFAVFAGIRANFD
jgi:vitamin B12 transporter